MIKTLNKENGRLKILSQDIFGKRRTLDYQEGYGGIADNSDFFLDTPNALPHLISVHIAILLQPPLPPPPKGLGVGGV